MATLFRPYSRLTLHLECDYQQKTITPKTVWQQAQTIGRYDSRCYASALLLFGGQFDCIELITDLSDWNPLMVSIKSAKSRQAPVSTCYLHAKNIPWVRKAVHTTAEHFCQNLKTYTRHMSVCMCVSVCSCMWAHPSVRLGFWRQIWHHISTFGVNDLLSSSIQLPIHVQTYVPGQSSKDVNSY